MDLHQARSFLPASGDNSKDRSVHLLLALRSQLTEPSICPVISSDVCRNTSLSTAGADDVAFKARRLLVFERFTTQRSRFWSCLSYIQSSKWHILDCSGTKCDWKCSTSRFEACNVDSILRKKLIKILGGLPTKGDRLGNSPIQLAPWRSRLALISLGTPS